MWKKGIITGAVFLCLYILYILWLWLRTMPGPGEYVKISYDDLVGWSSDNQSRALMAFQKSCPVFLSVSPSKKIIPAKTGGYVKDWLPACEAAEKLGPVTDHDARQFFEQHFTVLSYAKDIEGLFTGYFTPEYEGSIRPTEDYSSPLYALPPDLKILDLGQFRADLAGKSIVGEVRDGTFVPYKDREAIDKGALEDRKLEVVWLKDPTDAFFIHIQGSGIIRYENGDRRLFAYAGKNGRAYRAIGRFLIDRGDIDPAEMSMAAIRGWMTENPDEAQALMWQNPSYIFFRPLENESPVGSLNIPVTAGRSLAIDRAYMPLGMPVWLDVKASVEQAPPLRRLVISQDTGGAIKGRVRADIYWGIGAEAGRRAGQMKDRGRYYFLLPHDLAGRLLSEKGRRHEG